LAWGRDREYLNHRHRPHAGPDRFASTEIASPTLCRAFLSSDACSPRFGVHDPQHREQAGRAQIDVGQDDVLAHLRHSGRQALAHVSLPPPTDMARDGVTTLVKGVSMPGYRHLDPKD
jgi:hypothetical protein